MPRKPDILLIILDTTRRDHMSLYGYGRRSTPQLDDFAGGMSSFDRAISPAQWTVPAHASLFTGTYASEHGLTQAEGALSHRQATLAEILQVEGYHTVGFSNNPLVGVLDNGLTRGFENFYNYAAAAPNRPGDRARGPLRSALAAYFRRQARRGTNLFARHHALFRASLHPLAFPLMARLINYKGDTRRSLADLLDYWRARKAGSSQPLFAFINLMGAHTPYRPTLEALRQVAPEFCQDQRAFQYINSLNGDPAAWTCPAELPLEDWQYEAIEAFYAAEIAQQDRELGAVLRALESGGQLDNTLLIIVADHGEGHGDHGFFGHGFSCYQELIQVPLLIRFPQQFPAGRIRQNVSTRRLFHTILNGTAVSAPDLAEEAARLSLAQSLNGDSDPEEGLVYSEAFPPQIVLHLLRRRAPRLLEAMQLGETRRAVYQGEYKLALLGTAVEGLYNISRDPAEKVNIAAERPEIAASMQQSLLDYIERVRLPELPPGKLDGTVAENLRGLGYFD